MVAMVEMWSWWVEQVKGVDPLTLVAMWFCRVVELSLAVVEVFASCLVRQRSDRLAPLLCKQAMLALTVCPETSPLRQERRALGHQVVLVFDLGLQHLGQEETSPLPSGMETLELVVMLLLPLDVRRMLGAQVVVCC